VRKTIRRWEERGLGGLWEASGRGSKAKCKIEDIQDVAELLAQATRTYIAILIDFLRKVIVMNLGKIKF